MKYVISYSTDQESFKTLEVYTDDEYQAVFRAGLIIGSLYPGRAGRIHVHSLIMHDTPIVLYRLPDPEKNAAALAAIPPSV